jgi:hypothetical protein
VVNQQSVGAVRYGGFDEGQAGRDAGNHFAHLHPTFDLQAVGAIVTEFFGRKQRIERLSEQESIGHVIEGFVCDA